VTDLPGSSTNKPLTTREMARLLRRISASFDEEVIGTQRVADGLQSLARLLSKLPDQPITELTGLSKSKPRAAKRRWHEAASLSVSQIRRLLEEENLLKSELIELAHERFHIPRARLERLPLERVLETIWAAADNEESLRVIAANAERAGKNRSS
jgi:hypothetical protein